MIFNVSFKLDVFTYTPKVDDKILTVDADHLDKAAVKAKEWFLEFGDANFGDPTLIFLTTTDHPFMGATYHYNNLEMALTPDRIKNVR